MREWWVLFFLLLISSVSFALPYHVDKDILDEVSLNQQRYEQAPTSNEVMFDLAMSYAYSGQILKGWNLLKTIPKEYAPTVIKTYSGLMKSDTKEWRYPFKCAFGYFFIGEKKQAINLFKKVIEIKPDQVWAYGFIALIYGEMGDVDIAMQWSHKGLKIEPNATAIHFLLAEGHRKKKQYYKAFKRLLNVGRLQSK